MKRTLSLVFVIMMTLTLCLGGCTPKTPAPEPSSAASEGTPSPDSGKTSSGDAESSAPAASSEKTEPVEATVFGMNGPTGMGMAGLIADAKAGKTVDSYSFTMAAAADEYLADLIAGKFDFACIPTNLASVLSKKAAGVYKVAAVNTLGVLYLMDATGAVKTVEDVKGRTIYATGEGLIPEICLTAVLQKCGLTVGSDVQVEFLATAADVGAMYIAGTADLVMLPEPYATTVMTKRPLDIMSKIDLTAEWDRLFGEGSRLMTGCLAVNTAFLAAHPDAVQRFLDGYAASVEFVNSASDEAAQAVVDAGIVAAAPIAKQAIPHCNIVFIRGEEMKAALSGFYAEIFPLKPALLGGSLPEDSLYYVG